MAERILKVGIAGYGVVGKRRRACVERHKNLQMAAICDRVFEGSGVMDDGLPYYDDYKQLLNEDLDILIVCMTNDIAPEVTRAGLEKNLHVFCEKPPGRNVTDIEKVIEVERSHRGLKLMYGFNHRYHESVQDALNIIHSNKLGKIINLRGVYGKSKLITFNQPDWRTNEMLPGGEFY